MSSGALLSIPTYLFSKPIHSIIPVTIIQPVAISRILPGSLARGRESGRARGGSGQSKEDDKVRGDWSSGITCKCRLTSFVPLT